MAARIGRMIALKKSASEEHARLPLHWAQRHVESLRRDGTHPGRRRAGANIYVLPSVAPGADPLSSRCDRVSDVPARKRPCAGPATYAGLRGYHVQLPVRRRHCGLFRALPRAAEDSRRYPGAFGDLRCGPGGLSSGAETTMIWFPTPPSSRGACVSGPPVAYVLVVVSFESNQALVSFE